MPERFLDSEKNIKKIDHFAPFGIGNENKISKYKNKSLCYLGKRICIGESLAKAELFIIFARILQVFTFEACEGYEQPTDKPITGICMTFSFRDFLSQD